MAQVEEWLRWRSGSSGGIAQVAGWLRWRSGSGGGVAQVEEWHSCGIAQVAE